MSANVCRNLIRYNKKSLILNLSLDFKPEYFTFRSQILVRDFMPEKIIILLNKDISEIIPEKIGPH